MNSYQKRVQALLSPAERRVFLRHKTPQKIQDFLDSFPINFEIGGETYCSPRRTLREKTTHCFEGAVLAASLLAYHGYRPLLMDFQTIPKDEDHVVALFRDKKTKHWGAISKTNHSVLRFRDAVYRTPRELAMSYFHEYFLWNGKKSLRAYSAPFDLTRFNPERWVTAEKHLHWLVDLLDNSKHYSIAGSGTMRKLRPVSPIEIKALRHIEWPDPRKKKRKS